jgi:hypothetical protein
MIAFGRSGHAKKWADVVNDPKLLFTNRRFLIASCRLTPISQVSEFCFDG